MKFTEMGLSDYIVRGLAEQGIETATEIQELVMPVIKTGVDVIGLSQTGSGKTYAYGIPALENIDVELSATQFLVVCPTRELAVQIADQIRKLTVLTGNISVAPIVGGSHMDRQVQALKRGAKIVIGTPGRLMDHLRRKTLKLDKLKMVILDEADEMLNMGFKEDIETILKTTPDTRQTLMFSATMPKEIINLTKQYMKDATMIKTQNQESSHALIKQHFCNCTKNDKADVLCKIYEKFNPWISIVFCNTKRMTEELSKTLEQRGLPAVCLNGDMRQSERKRVMDNFKKSGNGGILVATDVAARGIDIKNVDIVINYDFPNNEDYYVHRIGRTGRAGKEGIAFNIITTRAQEMDLQDLTRRLGGTIEEYSALSTAMWAGKGFDGKGESKRGGSSGRGFGGRQGGLRDGNSRQSGERKQYGRQSEKRNFDGQGEKRDFGRRSEKREFGSRDDFKPRDNGRDSSKSRDGSRDGFKSREGGRREGFGNRENRQRDDFKLRENRGENKPRESRGSFGGERNSRSRSFDNRSNRDDFGNNRGRSENRGDGTETFEIGGGSRRFSRPIGKNTIPGHYDKPDFRERRTSGVGRQSSGFGRTDGEGRKSFGNDRRPSDRRSSGRTGERQSFNNDRQPSTDRPSFEGQSFKGGRQAPRTVNPRSPRQSGGRQGSQNGGGRTFNRSDAKRSSNGSRGKRF